MLKPLFLLLVFILPTAAFSRVPLQSGLLKTYGFKKVTPQMLQEYLGTYVATWPDPMIDQRNSTYKAKFRVRIEKIVEKGPFAGQAILDYRISTSNSFKVYAQILPDRLTDGGRRHGFISRDKMDLLFLDSGAVVAQLTVLNQSKPIMTSVILKKVEASEPDLMDDGYRGSPKTNAVSGGR